MNTVHNTGKNTMFGKTKKIEDKINGKEEEPVVEQAPKPKGRPRKVKDADVIPEVPLEASQEEVTQPERQPESEVTDDDILHNIDQDLGAANYMLRKRDIQELIDSEGVRIWSDILVLAEIALQDENVQVSYAKEYKIVEAQRIAYQRAVMEMKQKQASQTPQPPEQPE
jgi:hypothetical protein